MLYTHTNQDDNHLELTTRHLDRFNYCVDPKNSQSPGIKITIQLLSYAQLKHPDPKKMY